MRDDCLPQVTVCKGCSTVLFDGPDMEEPIETIRRHNGVCPGCGRQLTFNVEDIRISPVASEKMGKSTTLLAEHAPLIRPTAQKTG